MKPFYLFIMQGHLFETTKTALAFDKLRRTLSKYDRETFEERLDRLRYVASIFPDGLLMLVDHESAIVFGEAKMAFINGEYAATVLLAQAFIERRLQLIFEAEGNKKLAKASLEAKIDQLRIDGDIPRFVIDRLDSIRRKRNPFVHLKPVDHEYNLDRRMRAAAREQRDCDPVSILKNDAQEALAIMYTVAARIGSDVPPFR